LVQEAGWDFAPVEHPEGTRFNGVKIVGFLGNRVFGQGGRRAKLRDGWMNRMIPAGGMEEGRGRIAGIFFPNKRE